MDKGEWKEFFEFLNEISEGKGTGAFEKIDGSKDLKSWEEVIQRVNDCPGDEPITWQPLEGKNKE